MSAVSCDPGNVIQMSCIMGLAAPPLPVRGERSACEHCRREGALCGDLWQDEQWCFYGRGQREEKTQYFRLLNSC